METVDCPYCDASNYVSPDWLADGITEFDCECRGCGKTFTAKCEFIESWYGEEVE